MEYTAHYKLQLPDFDQAPWHDAMYYNFRYIDALINSSLGVFFVKGSYQNSTQVTTGERYFDESDGILYEVVFDHITAAAPTTFAEDRAANPTYWTSVSLSDAVASVNVVIASKGDAEAAAIAAEAARDEASGYSDDAQGYASAASASATAAAAAKVAAETAETNAETLIANAPATLATAAQGAKADQAILANNGLTNVVADWNSIHALGTGVYQANSSAANAPVAVGMQGIYLKYDANNGYLIATVITSSALKSVWTRRYLGGAWQEWTIIAGGSKQVTNWNSIVTPGHYWADNTAANLPAIADTYHAVVTGSTSGELFAIAIRRSNNNIYFRRRASSVWGSWTEITNSSNFLTTLVSNFASVPYVSAEQTITAAGLLTLAHGLGAEPSMIQQHIVCETADAGYAIGDKVFVTGAEHDSPSSVRFDDTNCYVRLSSSASSFYIAHKTSGVRTGITNANWKLVLKAYP